MSVESVRNLLNHTAVYAGFDVNGLDTSRRDAWVSLVYSGELTHCITERTPELNRIEDLCSRVIMCFYSLTLWAFHAGSRALVLIQQMLDESMDRTDEIKALIERTLLYDDDEGYGYGSADSYGIQAVEEGYGDASIAE